MTLYSLDMADRMGY